VQKIVTLRPAEFGFPLRDSGLSVWTPLVFLFKRDPDLLPFIRYLLNEHGIFTLEEWDEAPPRLFDRFGLEEGLRGRFRERVGRPGRAGLPDDGCVIGWSAAVQPA
jgi:hypothetical protein